MAEEAARLESMARSVENKKSVPKKPPIQDKKTVEKMESEVNNIRKRINEMHKSEKPEDHGVIEQKALEERKKYLAERI